MLKSLNPEHIEQVLRLINQGPYFKLLSMEVRDMGRGFSRVEMDIDQKHLNPFGGIHGGVYASLIDTATYWAVYCDVEESAGLISLDLQVDHLAPVKEGHVVVEGKRLKAGRHICLAEAAVRDSHGKVLARGTSKQMVVPGLQTIAQAVSAMGHAALAVKFLGSRQGEGDSW
jgi:uncharacterized protein (TIGR00369 family)